MGDRSSKRSDLPATAAALAAGVRHTPQMLIMFRAFLGSPQRTKLLLLGVAIVAVIVATAFGQVRLNAWNQPFYDALAGRAILDAAPPIPGLRWVRYPAPVRTKMDQRTSETKAIVFLKC